METLILVARYFMVYVIYSVGGWIMEEIHCSFREKKIVDRGFLIGPVCPIYGFGGLVITLALTQFQKSPIVVFCMGIVMCAFIEYFTSLVMEKIFKARWWDYSKEPLNLNGRICIRTLIPFGIFGLIIIYGINPYLRQILESIPNTPMVIIASIIAITMLTDFIVSMIVVSKVTSKSKKIAEEHPGDDTNQITEAVKDELKETFTGKRLVNAYPEFQTLKLKIKEVAEKSKEVAQKGKKAVKEKAKKVDIKTKRVIKTVKDGKK